MDFDVYLYLIQEYECSSRFIQHVGILSTYWDHQGAGKVIRGQFCNHTEYRAYTTYGRYLGLASHSLLGRQSKMSDILGNLIGVNVDEKEKREKQKSMIGHVAIDVEDYSEILTALNIPPRHTNLKIELARDGQNDENHWRRARPRLQIDLTRRNPQKYKISIEKKQSFCVDCLPIGLGFLLIAALLLYSFGSRYVGCQV